DRDWSSDVCSSDLRSRLASESAGLGILMNLRLGRRRRGNPSSVRRAGKGQPEALAQRSQIMLGDPFGERDDLRWKTGLIINTSQDLLDPALGVFHVHVFGDPHDVADQCLAAERHADPHAGSPFSLDGRGDGIGEDAEEPAWNSDLKILRMRQRQSGPGSYGVVTRKAVYWPPEVWNSTVT